MYKPQILQKILFIDIETAGISADFEELSGSMQNYWISKAFWISHRHHDESLSDPAQCYTAKAAIYPEFGKLVCISLGFIADQNESEVQVKTTSFMHSDERLLLLCFFEFLASHFNGARFTHLCGHNIREFDIPFICRRGLVNGLKLPDCINHIGKSRWQVHNLIDTMLLWRFGDYKHYSSLDLLCHIMQMDSPKSDLSGDKIHESYWRGQYDEIKCYCEKDVFATAQLFCHLNSWHTRKLFIHQSVA